MLPLPAPLASPGFIRISYQKCDRPLVVIVTGMEKASQVYMCKTFQLLTA